MLFDQLCGIIENDRGGLFEAFSSLKNDLKNKVKLFHIDENPQNIVKNGWSNYSDKESDFFLPFPMMAIEDNKSVTLIFDTEHNQKGLSNFRKAISFNGQEIFITEFCLVYDVKIGFAIKHQNTKYGLEKGKPKAPKNILEEKKIIQPCLELIINAVKEIIYLNIPSNFILEERPVNGNGKVNSKKIPRSNRRSKYIFLSPGEIRKRYLGYDNITEIKRTKSPHERRRHIRRYPDDPERFPKAHGKEVIIPACWIGTQERLVGNKIYKVRVDL